MPTVSVIIPNYNHASFLKQRINSVLHQTFQDFEIIILDDCSTDNSKEIIEDYRLYPKVKHITYNKANSSSTFKQWEKGINLATGELIWIAESDDVVEPTFLEKLVTLAAQNSNIVLAYCATEFIDEKGKSLGLNNWAAALDPVRWQNVYINDGKDEIEQFLHYRNTIPNASAVIFQKKSALFIYQLVKKKMKFAGDWIFWVSVLAHGKIAYTNEVLNYQRDHQQTSRSHMGIALEIKRVKEYIQSIQTTAKIAHIRIDWRSPKYDWIFQQCSLNIPYSKKTLLVFWYKTLSLNFLSRLFKKYRIKNRV